MQRLLISTAFVMFASIAENNATAEEGRPSNARSNEESPELKAELDDIAGIRERLGINLFKDTIFENESQDPSSVAQFLEVYRRFAKSRPKVVQAATNQVAIRQPQRDRLSGEVKLFLALYEAGRQLDASASSREAAGRFEEAGQLRKLARKIRRLLPELDTRKPIPEANRPFD